MVKRNGIVIMLAQLEAPDAVRPNRIVDPDGSAWVAKGYQVHYQQFVGGQDGLSWRGGPADGLINLLGRY